MKFEYIQWIFTLLLSGGLLTGIYTILKIRPEAGQITVVAAQGAVLVQGDVIKSLKEELVRVRETLSKEILDLRKELTEVREENISLRFRLRNLENK